MTKALVAILKGSCVEQSQVNGPPSYPPTGSCPPELSHPNPKTTGIKPGPSEHQASAPSLIYSPCLGSNGHFCYSEASKK